MRRTLSLLAVALLLPVIVYSQDVKLGYTNIDAIVFSMPDMASINAELDTYRSQLASQVQNKRSEIQAKRQAWQDMAQDPNAISAVLQDQQTELDNLQMALQNFTAQAEQAIGSRQADLLNPVYQKVQNAIEAVRAEQGYTLILNAQIGGAGGIVLAGRAEDDVTAAVFAKLGVPMPSSITKGAPPALPGIRSSN